MKKSFTNASRRYFLQRIAIASTTLIAFPTILWAKNSTKLLGFAIFGDNAGIAEMIEKSGKMTLVNDLKFADVIYVGKEYQKSQNIIQKILKTGKHLMIEDHEDTEFLIENCRNLGNSMTIIERSSDDSKLFNYAHYYERNDSEVVDFHKVIGILAFLEQHTKPLEFKIKDEYKPVEIPVS